MSNSYSYETIRRVNNQWMHLVLNFIGPKKEEGIELFRDGALITSYQTQIEYQLTPGEGRLTLGRWTVTRDSDYPTIDVDEVVFFNRKLTAPEVETIYNKNK